LSVREPFTALAEDGLLEDQHSQKLLMKGTLLNKLLNSPNTKY